MTDSPASLLASARRAMAAGDFATAQATLMRVLAIDKRCIPAWLNLAAVRRQRNDFDGAFAALRETLKIEPRNFHALLMSGTLHEREGSRKEAASTYGAALAQAPPDQYLDPPTLQAVQHARAVHAQYKQQLNEFIRARVADAQSRCTSSVRKRIDAFIDTTLRTRKRYLQEPTDYYYPGLQSIEFYERDEFPWLAELEAATADIQNELISIVCEAKAGFEPYIQYDDHLPLDQWRELNRSPRWSAFHFYDRGKPIEERCRHAPATMAAIAKLPQPRVLLRSPTAMFSVLQPCTHIPPHTGVANFRLVVHLPLIVPPGCRFRVGGETREWRVGEAWVFDDTIEHEAWNDSDETRVILICDVWSPRLAEEERALIAQVIAATDAFNQTLPGAQV